MKPGISTIQLVPFILHISMDQNSVFHDSTLFASLADEISKQGLLNLAPNSHVAQWVKMGHLKPKFMYIILLCSFKHNVWAKWT